MWIKHKKNTQSDMNADLAWLVNIHYTYNRQPALFTVEFRKHRLGVLSLLLFDGMFILCMIFLYSLLHVFAQVEIDFLPSCCNFFCVGVS